MNIALLRGINVGGHKKIAMSDLRRLFEDLGFRDVKSLLQSGNVVFGSDRRTAVEMERLLQLEMQKRLATEADFFVKSAKEWSGVVAANPFRREAEADPGHLVVMCMRDVPDKAAVRLLQAAIAGPEMIRANGKHLYIVYPAGIGTSRLTNVLIERKLGTRGTARNWNTVLKLHALVNSGE